LEGAKILIDPVHSYFLLPFFFYAETHYRFRHFFSYLEKNEPEVIADIPHRIEPGNPIPVLILAKDAHLYPCVLNQVSAEIREQGKVVQRTNLLEKPLTLGQKLFSVVFRIDRAQFSGWLDIDVAMTLEVNGTAFTYHNDNHKTSSRRPLRVYLSQHPLPSFPGLCIGDPHTHSNYTDDQVEFGSPLSASRELSRAMGLSFFCVTDHSYDLDDRVDSYLEYDPLHPKWNSFQQEVDSLNGDAGGFAIVRGEEVTCRNTKGRNVHFLVFGQREFIRGSGDGAEKWLRTKSEHNIGEVINRKSIDAVAYAAHAQEPVPFLQRLLLNRGSWSIQDFRHEGLTGLQILNGKFDIGFERSYSMWIKLLLGGHRLCAIAGNDAHGNFNRYRQIGIPFFTIREEEQQVFGKCRTGVFVDSILNEKSVLSALTHGRAIMTDGPVVRLSAVGSGDLNGGIGGTARTESLRLSIDVLSSGEFGEINAVRVIVGKVGNSAEQTAFRFEGNQGYSINKNVSLNRPSISYVRVEVTTAASGSYDGKAHFCFTNPVWVDLSI
jgi:hypothetical protein